MTEEIIEEYNPLVRAITKLEGALVALGLYWFILGFLVFNGVITGDQFTMLVKDGTVVITLLKIISSSNSN